MLSVAKHAEGGVPVANTLYELTETFQQIYAMLTFDEVDEQAIADTLEAIGLESDFETKADGYAKVIRMLKADAAAADAEAKRLEARKRTFESQADRMKQRLQEAMQATGKTKFKTPLFTYGIQNNAESVTVTDENAIPTQYMRVTTARAPDKEAIKEALKAGVDIPGAMLTRTESLRIR